MKKLEQGSMYTSHFSLQSLPFENVPDPAFFFNQGDYSRVLSRMVDSLRMGKGLMVVAGPIGTGKTTLSQKVMATVPESTRIVWLGEPPDTSDELLLFLAQEMHISPELSSRIFILRDIREYLLKLHSEGNHCLMIMDEVHKISDDVLECIRLLNNLEQGGLKLIQMLLLGQEELLIKLSRPELESFKQRIAWLEILGKMTPAQTHKYIMHRLKVAGSQSGIFTDDAMEALVTATRGTPRLVNTFCDRALRVGYESNKTVVDLDSVRRAADDIGLGTEVFLWLTNRDIVTTWKVGLNASFIEDNSGQEASDTKIKEPDKLNKNQSYDKHQDTSTRSVFTLMNELFDKTIGRLSNKPIVQLIASSLLFAASVCFFIVRVLTE